MDVFTHQLLRPTVAVKTTSRDDEVQVATAVVCFGSRKRRCSDGHVELELIWRAVRQALGGDKDGSRIQVIVAGSLSQFALLVLISFRSGEITLPIRQVQAGLPRSEKDFSVFSIPGLRIGIVSDFVEGTAVVHRLLHAV